MGLAMARGWRGRCPGCGQTKLYATWLGVAPRCACCAAPLGLLRADDAPPYIVIFITGHLVIGAEVALDRMAEPSMWLEAAIFLPLALFMCVGLLRPVKGALIGLMLHLGMFTPPLAGSLAAELPLGVAELEALPAGRRHG